MQTRNHPWISVQMAGGWPPRVGGVSGHVLHGAKHKTALRTLFSVTWHVSVESRDMSCTLQNTRQHCARCFLSLGMCRWSLGTCPARCKTQDSTAHAVFCHFASLCSVPRHALHQLKHKTRTQNEFPRTLLHFSAFRDTPCTN